MHAPSGVRSLTLCRSKSPELIDESCGNLCRSRSDCVPFPTPGAPTRMTRAALRRRILWGRGRWRESGCRVAWTGRSGSGMGGKESNKDGRGGRQHRLSRDSRVRRTRTRDVRHGDPSAGQLQFDRYVISTQPRTEQALQNITTHFGGGGVHLATSQVEETASAHIIN